MRKIPVLEGVTEIYQRIRALYDKGKARQVTTISRTEHSYSLSVVPPKPPQPIKPFKPFSPRRSPARLSERVRHEKHLFIFKSLILSFFQRAATVLELVLLTSYKLLLYCYLDHYYLLD
jgi:hypothetical protein